VQSPQDKQGIIDRYRERLQEHGPTLAALGVASAERMRLRHEVVAGVGDLRGASVLDVGCGFGDFYRECYKRIPTPEYTGIDMVEELIDEAKKRYRGARFIVGDFFTHDFGRSFDYVACDGVFNNRYRHCSNIAVVHRAIDRAYALATKGVAFSFMSRYVDFREDYLYYYDPLDIFDFCKTLTKRVTLRHDYPLFEFTVYLYPDWEGWADVIKCQQTSSNQDSVSLAA
jgi:SAM-dependent methyltransferase